MANEKYIKISEAVKKYGAKAHNIRYRIRIGILDFKRDEKSKWYLVKEDQIKNLQIRKYEYYE